MIPKIVHYCWLSNDPVPEDLKRYMDSWKRNLHGYEYILWDFNRFDISTSLWVKQAFEAKKYAFAADYIRLYALYNYGGIYLDMDIEVLKTFNDLLYNQMIVAYEDDKKIGFEAGCLGAEKYSVYIKKCLDYYDKREFINFDGIYDTLPLPRIMNDLILSLLNKDNIEIYHSDYFTAKSFRTGIITITDNTYCIHHFAGSWLSEIDKKNIEIQYKIFKYLGDSYFSNLLLRFIFVYKHIKKYGICMSIKYYFYKIFNIR
ncbi:glycosyltransferase family 32 [Treponema primitia ZAS-2]|uniref:Glycosyltransferase family 32 n=1 Tax=Treponema primitia (strain ATCC BAA-887 / DSM 12427 / ZAS-2) TaxID=545694 RepID=F5YNY3_TREPZ|nr:glycosyltransferase [Treponema primitia]AEF84277.1 glycosyltransferase family 32 [Treponema primitia ZAS-2]